MWLRASLSADEPLARVLTSSGHFSRKNNRVKEPAFLPNAKLKTSVYRTQGMSDPEMWALADECVAGPTGKTCYGVGVVTVRDVSDNELSVDPDDEPPRHANIVGWPAADTADDKAKRKALALRLANAATLRLRS